VRTSWGKARGRGVVVALAACVLAVSGCTETRSATGSPPPGLEPTTTPTSDPFSELPTGAIFLPLDQWRPSTSGRSQALSPCLRHPLSILGAETYRVRAFTAIGDEDVKGQDVLVAYHDVTAAKQGFFIFKEWQQTCDDDLDSGHSWERTKPIRVIGPGDEAAWFRLVRDGSVRYTTGLIRVGSVVGMVTILNSVIPGVPFAAGRKMNTMLQRAARRI
jgi:hypothetical protein